jgi:hypothetical protein
MQELKPLLASPSIREGGSRVLCSMSKLSDPRFPFEFLTPRKSAA